MARLRTSGRLAALGIVVAALFLSGCVEFPAVKEEPPRLYVDIDGVWIEEPVAQAHERDGDTPVRRVRGGQNTLTRARVVMDLDVPGRNILVTHAGPQNHAHEDVYVAMRDAFAALERRVHDHIEKRGP